jgi:glycosyltransferase involved in cell wall biosynthesis
MSCDVSIVVPVYNEEKSIRLMYTRLISALTNITSNFEIIYINDGSHDNSIIELLRLSEEDARVKYINFSRNFGHQIAVTAGLEMSIGDAVVIIDGDLQDPPEVIPEMYLKYKEGYEVVYGQRLKRKGESFFKKITAKYFYRLLKKITNVSIPVDTGDFRLIDRKIVDGLKKMPEQNKFLRGQIAWLGYRQTSVFFEREERKYGNTGYPFSKMLKFALDGITGFSDVPLQFVTKTGIFISMFSFFIILYAIFSYFVLKITITGWTSLIISSMFIGGVQLISIGIIGEYISRINKNVQNRPLYIIDTTNIQNRN